MIFINQKIKKKRLYYAYFEGPMWARKKQSLLDIPTLTLFNSYKNAPLNFFIQFFKKKKKNSTVISVKSNQQKESNKLDLNGY